MPFNTDQFAMFKLADANKAAAQTKLAAAIMDPGFQSAFNVVKGSAPARTDVPDTAFDDCGKKAIKDVAEANKNNTLVGSMAHGHAVPASIKNAFYDVITRHFNGQIDDKKAVCGARLGGKELTRRSLSRPGDGALNRTNRPRVRSGALP